MSFQSPISDAQKLTYAGMYILKKIDLKPKEGGENIGIMRPENTAIEPVLDHLMLSGCIAFDRKKQFYTLTPKGVEYLGSLIDEAEQYVEEFDDEEIEDMLEELRTRNLDLFRVRFLWGWYQGEFDDLYLFQQRRGIEPLELLWQNFIMSDEFYENLALDLKTTYQA